jgi:acyl-coenzyme A thioesterase PaaI-like protein
LAAAFKHFYSYIDASRRLFTTVLAKSRPAARGPHAHMIVAVYRIFPLGHMQKYGQSVYQRWTNLVQERGFDRAFEAFGPYSGAAISVHTVDPLTVEVCMPLIETNTNYVGTHFGGSLYSMCDPFFMFILMHNLGDDYIVWDKAASIEFIKPGLGTVTARFHIPTTELDFLRVELPKIRKTDRIYECEIKDESDAIVARIKKTLYIRLMKKKETHLNAPPEESD